MILMFQNVIHKSRHVIPIIMVLHFFIITTQKFQFWKNISSRVIPILFIISTISVTSVLTYQHRSPSAVSKLKDDLMSATRYAVMSLRYSTTETSKWNSKGRLGPDVAIV